MYRDNKVNILGTFSNINLHLNNQHIQNLFKSVDSEEKEKNKRN